MLSSIFRQLAPTLLRDARSTLPTSLRLIATTRPISIPAHVSPNHPSKSTEQPLPSSSQITLPPHLSPHLFTLSYADSAGVWRNIIQAAPRIMTPDRTPEQIWAVKHDTFVRSMPRISDAYSGRSIPVLKGNLSEAYGKLELRLRTNKVKAEVRYQERHEKKGVKRRRLSSERWRKRFAHEVRKKVQLVDAIRRRGA